MARRRDLALGVAFLLAVAGGMDCSRAKTQTVEVGRHRVRFALPRGWERLDHGRRQLFRNGEAQISLADLGPGTADAMAAEIGAAESLWRQGRRWDAFQRVRDLRGPALRFAPSRRRADFWKPWTDVTYVPEVADSAAIGPAFQALIAGAAALGDVAPESLLEYVLTSATDMQRREIASRTGRTVHGSDWVEVKTWDRVSHLHPSRLAFLVNGGYLLVLSTDHGAFERTGPGFEAVLSSLEIVADSLEAR